MKQQNNQRLQRYRQRNRRYDFYASPDVVDIIAYHQATGTETCIAGIIDGLIRAGHRIVAGNGSRK